MLFVVVCIDKPGTRELRIANRPKHVAFLDGLKDTIVLAGPMLDDRGDAIGSMLLLEAADPAEARRLAAADPYAKAQLFESVRVEKYRISIKDGVRLTLNGVRV
jgi:uncharacterized protein YciI